MARRSTDRPAAAGPTNRGYNHGLDCPDPWWQMRDTSAGKWCFGTLPDRFRPDRTVEQREAGDMELPTLDLTAPSGSGRPWSIQGHASRKTGGMSDGAWG